MLFLLLVASPLLLLHAGCVKEYSFEGNQADSIPTLDTIPATRQTLPVLHNPPFFRHAIFVTRQTRL